jgi:pilus assembly protein CpaB
LESKRILLISVLMGLLGAILVFMYISQKEKELVKGMNPVIVLVASKDIPQKSLIDTSMLKSVQIPEKFVEPTAVLFNDPKQDIKKVLGKVNLVPILAGQQITQSQLVPPSEETGLSVKVPVKRRAIVVPIANVDMKDLIKPGDYVDILNTFTAKMKTGASTKVTVTVLQNILVLGVGKDLGDIDPSMYAKKNKKGIDEESAKTFSVLTISLAVTPEEAQLVALAVAQGDIYITIRNNNDNEGSPLRPVDTTLFLR